MKALILLLLVTELLLLTYTFTKSHSHNHRYYGTKTDCILYAYYVSRFVDLFPARCCF